jgi:hypothetical protein
MFNIIEALKTTDPTDVSSLFDGDDFISFVRSAADRRESEQKIEEQADYEKELSALLRAGLENKFEPELADIANRSPSTKRVYTQDCKAFKDYCDQINVTWRPASPEVVACFLVEEHERGAGSARLRRLRSAISYAHQLGDHFDPTRDIIVQAVMQRLGSNEQDKEGNENEQEQ